VLTNSLAATDVAAVHAGYAKRRRALLAAGIELHELRRLSPLAQAHRPGSSASSLHAKTFAVDRRQAFVGSFNFDPRSLLLNTELGLVIDSPALARRIAKVFEFDVPQAAYEVRLSEEGDLVWMGPPGADLVLYDAEPEVGVVKRAWTWLLARLPIDWLL